jgi:hypothetical protein
MARACANCGTEVDDDALFCPTCGEPIERGGEPDLPPAPDWPASPAGVTTSSAPLPASGQRAEEADEMEPEPEHDPTRAAPAVAPGVLGAPPTPEYPHPAPSHEDTEVPPWRRGAAYRAASPPAPEASAPIPPRPGALRPEGILRPPTTLSGWLIGIGVLVGTAAMLLPWAVSGTYTGGWGLASGINLLFTLVLIAVLVVVFLPHVVPEVPHRNLVLLSIALVGVGVGLDRLGLPLTGSGAMIFLIGMLASATGAFLAQLGLDRTVGGTLR